MQISSRTNSSDAYRYGFNGKEKEEDGEFGSLTHYDYGFRIYNPGIGRFLSVDPLTRSYPWYTPYQFAGNTAISAIDLDGLEEFVVINNYFFDDKTGELKLTNSSTINAHSFIFGFTENPSAKWMDKFKKGNVNWLYGKDDYFAKKKEVADYKYISTGRFRGAKKIGSHLESVPQTFGTLTINRITDSKGNTSTSAGFTPDYKSQAIINGLSDILYGSLTIAGSGVTEAVTFGASSEVSIPAVVYGSDQFVSGFITLGKVSNGDFDNSNENTDNRLLRALFTYIGGDGATKIYDIGNIVLNAKGFFELTTNQSNNFKQFISNLGDTEQLGESVLKKEN